MSKSWRIFWFSICVVIEAIMLAYVLKYPNMIYPFSHVHKLGYEEWVAAVGQKERYPDRSAAYDFARYFRSSVAGILTGGIVHSLIASRRTGLNTRKMIGGLIILLCYIPVFFITKYVKLFYAWMLFAPVQFVLFVLLFMLLCDWRQAANATAVQ